MKESKDITLFASDPLPAEPSADEIESTPEYPPLAPDEETDIELDGKTDIELDAKDSSALEPTEPDGTPEAQKADADDSAIAALKEEIEALRAEITALEQLKKNQDRILSELADFAALFPEVAVDEIPEEVWEAVRKGTSLTASFALYEKRKAAEAVRIANVNAKNASRSPGAAGTDTASEYFSPDDVRRMSRAEVHANYSKIKESMKKWMQR